jgi:hypothetical protein
LTIITFIECLFWRDNMAETSLFSLNVDGNKGNWAHGSATLAGTTSGNASLHRGLRLGASVELSGAIAGQLSNVVVGNVKIGADAKASLDLEARFPLDLFTEAGLIGRAEAVAEAAAWIQAELGLNAAEFANYVAANVPEPWRDVVRLFWSTSL